MRKKWLVLWLFIVVLLGLACSYAGYISGYCKGNGETITEYIQGWR